MIKYDCTLDMKTHNSLAIILKQIKPGSTILEIGPSTGRMTRYLKENLHCDVFIIEYDQQAFNKAKKYAKWGICGDVETLNWEDCFHNICFDYVIFADVLEHLRNPEKTLENTKKVLSKSGKVFISLPNIGHYTVLRELMNGEFNYTDTGILDRTHLRFFTYKSAVEFVCDAGFYIIREDATYYNDSDGTFAEGILSENLETAIKQIPYATVFQFVFTAISKENKATFTEVDVEKNIRQMAITDYATLYYDDGSGFCAAHICQADKWISDSRNFTVEFRLPNVLINALRFDPCEYACTVKMLCCESNIGSLSFTSSNADYTDKGYDVFMSLDPQYLLSFEDPVKVDYVRIQGEFQKITSKELYFFQNKQIQEDQKQLAESWSTVCKLEESLSNLSHNADVANERLKEIENILSDTREKKAEVEQALHETRTALTEKERVLDETRTTLDARNQMLFELQTTLQKKELEYDELQACVLKIEHEKEHYQKEITDLSGELKQAKILFIKCKLDLEMKRREVREMTGQWISLIDKKNR